MWNVVDRAQVFDVSRIFSLAGNPDHFVLSFEERKLYILKGSPQTSNHFSYILFSPTFYFFLQVGRHQVGEITWFVVEFWIPSIDLKRLLMLKAWRKRKHLIFLPYWVLRRHTVTTLSNHSPAPLCKYQTLSMTHQRDTLCRRFFPFRACNLFGSFRLPCLRLYKLSRKEISNQIKSLEKCWENIELTFQELVQSINPVLCVLLVGRLEPYESALDVRLWRHWAESEARVGTDQTVFELPFGFTLIQGLVKYGKYRSKEASEGSIEKTVKQKDFRWKRNERKKGLKVSEQFPSNNLIKVAHYRIVTFRYQRIVSMTVVIIKY